MPVGDTRCLLLQAAAGTVIVPIDVSEIIKRASLASAPSGFEGPREFARCECPIVWCTCFQLVTSVA